MIAMVRNQEDMQQIREFSSFTEFNYTTSEEGIAVVALNSPTTYHSSYFFTNSAYLSLKATIERAMQDAEVKTIVLSINSPGGEVAGLMETAKYIHEKAQTKSIYAYTDSLACSASYLLAAACSRVYSSPFAEVGCCGVICQATDYSEYEKKNGFLSKIFRSKNAQKKNLSPFTEEGEKQIQTRLDELEDGYFEALAIFRGAENVEKIKTLEGSTVLGKEALEVGLIDKLSSYEEFINDISSLIESEGENMDYASMTAEQRASEFKALCSVDSSLLASVLSEERNRISALNALRKPYCSALIDKAIEEGKSAADVALDVLALVNEENAKVLAEKEALKPIVDISEKAQEVKNPVANDDIGNPYLAAADNLNKENK